MDKTTYQRIRHNIVCYCQQVLEQGLVVDRTLITNAIDSVLSNPIMAATVGVVNDQEKERLRFDIETQINVSISDEVVALRNQTVHRWLDHKRDEINWDFWSAYRAFLESEGRASDVISSLEKVVDLALDSTGDPTIEGTWRRSGLVMGNVQSGKTQNYIGLINKAIDTGYKVIILLGGHLNELRNQTQSRVDEGVIGRESIQLAKIQGRDRSKRVGVGNFRSVDKQVFWFTSKNADFSKATADQVGVSFNGVAYPIIFVVKKNAHVLKTLYDWIVDKHELDIRNGKVLSQPLLLIDDEADYASINTKHSKNDITAINEGIRKLLSTSARTTYLGYTATPFANIFIAPDKSDDEIIGDDLFPKDLMVKMPAPDNYVGHNYFFPYDNIDEGQEVSNAVKVIDDFEITLPAKSNKNTVVVDLCDSLKQAVQIFLLATSLRYLKCSSLKEHSTMLVNMSHLKLIQNQLANLIESYVEKFKRANELHGAEGCEKAVESSVYFSELADLHSREFPEEAEFSTIYPILRKVISKVKIFAVNTDAANSLDYDEYKENGLVAIAVGGHKLSRGLTLEGLLVSYFTRNSKMYDTLMQMCRWFGYRPGYKEYCRLFISEQSLAWYTFIAEAIDELYDDLERMAYYNKTPSEFGLKVREHPGALLVTAKTKMQTAESCIRSVDYAGERYRRFDFFTDNDENEKNLRLTKSLIACLVQNNEYTEIEDDGSYLFYNVEYEDVINYVKDFSVYDSDKSKVLILDYLNKLRKAGIPKFRVCLRNQKKSSPTWWSRSKGTEEKLPSNVNYHDSLSPITAARRRLSFNDDGSVMRSHKSELGDPRDENLLTGKATRDKASASAYIKSPDRDFPGLIIYTFAVGVVEPAHVVRALDKEKISDVKVPHEKATVGYSMSFPLISNLKGFDKEELRRLQAETKVQYQTNVIWREVFNEDDLNDIYDDDE